MRYQQTLEIHQRLETVLRLIRTGDYSTPALAEAVRVSIPTISRIVASLREQGHEIRAERRDGGWRYVLCDAEKPRKRKHGYAQDPAPDIKTKIHPRLANQDEASGNPPSRLPAVPHKTATIRNRAHEAGTPQKQVSFR